MINIGCFANFNYPYKSEVEFAMKNNLKILQIWYDRDGIALNMDPNPVQAILDNPYPSIIHAVLDIVDFKQHIPKLLDILLKLNHKEIIIHPVCKNDVNNPKNINTLSKLVKEANSIFKPHNIKLYIENNSKLDNLLNSPQEIKLLFQENPDVFFLFDIAHVDTQELIEEIINVKFPDMLHVADKHYDVTHEHLPIGYGDLNFNYIFGELLSDFHGNIILEIVKDKESIVKSKELLDDICNSNKEHILK